MKKSIILTVVLALAFSCPVLGKVLGTPIKLKEVKGAAMATSVENNYLYIGSDHFLYIYDISKPLEPKLVSKTPGFANIRQVLARKGFVYIVSRETGMYIVDARNASKPKVCSRFDTVEFATGIDVAGDVAFVSERQNGVEFVDVSDPYRPAHITMRKTEESQSNQYRDGWLFSGDWHSGEVTIFDARDMKNIKEVSRANLGGFGDGLTLEGNYLYASTGHEARHRNLSKEEGRGRGRGMDIYDISDPRKPKHMSRLNFPRFFPHNNDFWTVRVSNGMAFALDSYNGFFVVDVKDPAKPEILERFTFPCKEHPDWPSECMSSLALGDGCVYLTAWKAGAYVIPVEGVKKTVYNPGVLPKNASYREAYPTDSNEFYVWKSERPGQARAVALTNDYVFAACGEAGLSVLKIKESGGFEKVGELAVHSNVYDVIIANGKVFTAEGYDGIGVYEWEAPATFREVGRLPQMTEKANVVIWLWNVNEKYIVASARVSGYRFYDITDLKNLKYCHTAYGTCLWDKYLLQDGLIGGKYLGLHVPYKNVQWLDVTSDKIPVVRKDEIERETTLLNSFCRFGDNSVLLTAKGDYAIIALGEDGLPMASWEYKSLPNGFGKEEFQGMPRACGDRVVITSRILRKAAVYDFSNRENPKLEKAWKLSGNPDLAVFYKGRVIIPAGHQGVIMEKTK